MKNSMEITLSELPLNSLGYISKINCNENIKRRLLDIGLTSGTSVECVLESPGKDICAYLIRGSVIAIRKVDAKEVEVSLL